MCHAAQTIPLIASCVVCLACLVPSNQSSAGGLFSLLPLIGAFAACVLGLARLCRLLLNDGAARTVHATLRLARFVLFLKASSYFVVLAACVYLYDGRNPAASLLCWMVMGSKTLDHIVFDPGLAVVQLAAIPLLPFGMAHLSPTVGNLGAATFSTTPRGVDQESPSSEWLLLSVLLIGALAKVGRRGLLAGGLSWIGIQILRTYCALYLSKFILRLNASR